MHLDFPSPSKERTGYSNVSLLLWTDLDIYLILVSTTELQILPLYSSNKNRREALKTGGKLN